ncbi:hypothetical protein Tco_0364683 [Tanacetum coccineum]
MLVEMIAERKKFFAAQRAAKQRSKPPTKNQLRNRMCTYLKNMGGYKHTQLKRRSYEEILNLFDKAYKQILQDTDREDLETLWKLVKAKQENTRAEEDYERVLWGDLNARIVGFKRLQDILRVTAAQLQLLSDYYCWKDYADRDEINDLSEKR